MIDATHRKSWQSVNWKTEKKKKKWLKTPQLSKQIWLLEKGYFLFGKKNKEKKS